MEFHNKDFELKHVIYLINIGKEYQRMRNQWIKSNHLDIAFLYDSKLKAIVELLESITVFHKGDGLNCFKKTKRCIGVDERFETFFSLL